MQKILFAGLAFGALCNVALAEPMKLTEAQMGDLTAGVEVNGSNGLLPPSFLLFITTEQIDQTNVATVDQVGAAIGLAGLAGVFQSSTITQVND